MNKLLYPGGKKYEKKVIHYTERDIVALGVDYFTEWAAVCGWVLDHCFRMKNTSTGIYWYVVVLRKEVTR
jgi:hypothetical protein